MICFTRKPSTLFSPSAADQGLAGHRLQDRGHGAETRKTFTIPSSYCRPISAMLERAGRGWGRAKVHLLDRAGHRTSREGSIGADVITAVQCHHYSPRGAYRGRPVCHDLLAKGVFITFGSIRPLTSWARR